MSPDASTDRRRAARREPWGAAGYLFASPWLLGLAVVTAGPMAVSLLLSFVKWDGLNLGEAQWVGWANYRRALGDEDVAIALWNTAYYTFASVPLGLAAALGLAVLLNQPLRGMAWFRTIFYMPAVIGGVATMMMWLWVFNPDFGLLNTSLRALASPLVALGWVPASWQPPQWLYDPLWSKPSLVLMSVWGCGGAMLIFLAALQNVPPQLYEAARIDGAGRWRRFTAVTVPQVSPAIFFNLIMGIIGSFQSFEQAYLMTSGGPNRSTLFFVLYLYQKAFQDFEFGYGSALAWVLFAIILVFTLIIVRSSKAWVHYEGDKP